MKKELYIAEWRRESLGFKSIMHHNEVAKIMEKVGLNVTSSRYIGDFAAENGYDSFTKNISNKTERFYKIKGAPIPTLKSLGIRK